MCTMRAGNSSSQSQGMVPQIDWFDLTFANSRIEPCSLGPTQKAETPSMLPLHVVVKLVVRLGIVTWYPCWY